LQSVAAVLTQIAGEPIAPERFDESRLPTHLRMNVKVVDDSGETVTAGRDLREVRRQVGGSAGASLSAADESVWSRDGVMQWNFGDVPPHIDVQRGGFTMRAFPSLVDQGESVSLRLADTPEKAARWLRSGLRRLFVLKAGRKLTQQVDYFPELGRMKLLAATLPDAGRFRLQLADLIADRAFFGNEPALPRAEAEFHRRCDHAMNQLSLAVQDVIGLVKPLLENYQAVRSALEDEFPAAWDYAALDMLEQLEELVRPGFLSAAPWPWLRQYPRYFRAMTQRLERLRGSGLDRDRQADREVQRYWQAFLARRKSHAERDLYDPQLALMRWMIEEFRVSQFAQKLGTAVPISAKRLDDQWAKVKA
jgi:ATP-dependent helicase HrpA